MRRAVLAVVAILAAVPARAETVRTEIGPRLAGCRMASGPTEAMTCDGAGGWRVHVGFPAFGATLALSQGDRPGSGGPAFALDGVGSRQVPAVWEVRVAGSRRIAEAVVVPVTVMHPDDRERMIAIGRPTADARRADLLLVYRLGEGGACLAALVDRSVNPAAVALARTAAAERGSCPATPQVVGRQSPTLEAVLAGRP